MPKASPKLVTVGDNCLDVYLSKGVLTVGGNALNVAVQWQLSGWDARYFGAVGDDPAGEMVLNGVAAAGLSPADVERHAGDTAVTLIRDDNGERTFLLEALGVGKNYLPDDERYDVIAAADWVHLGTNSNADLVRRLVADGIPFSVDISTAHEALPLDGVPLVFASASDQPPEALIRELRRKGMRQLVVTSGSRGAWFDDGSTIWHGEATPVAVVDTCGAGDSFIATFLAGLHLEGLEVRETLAKASAAAARTCLHLGGFPQEPLLIPASLLAQYADYAGLARRNSA